MAFGRVNVGGNNLGNEHFVWLSEPSRIPGTTYPSKNSFKYHNSFFSYGGGSYDSDDRTIGQVIKVDDLFNRVAVSRTFGRTEQAKGIEIHNGNVYCFVGSSTTGIVGKLDFNTMESVAENRNFKAAYSMTFNGHIYLSTKDSIGAKIIKVNIETLESVAEMESTNIDNAAFTSDESYLYMYSNDGKVLKVDAVTMEKIDECLIDTGSLIDMISDNTSVYLVLEVEKQIKIIKINKSTMVKDVENISSVREPSELIFYEKSLYLSSDSTSEHFIFKIDPETLDEIGKSNVGVRTSALAADDDGYIYSAGPSQYFNKFTNLYEKRR